MSKTFQYREALAETALSEMFANIYRHRVPGLFEISRGETSKHIYISGGNIIHAESTDRADRLGAHLYRLGKLTRKQLVDTMRQRSQSGKRHGELLIEQGLLSPGQLYEAIRSQMEAIVWSVFSWQDGEVTFKIGEFCDSRRIRIHLPMRQVIVRGVKKVPDAKALVARLGRKSTVFQPRYTTEELLEIALDHEEYALLRLVDGTRSLFEVCTRGPYSASENARLLYAFHILHLIERSTEGGSKSSGAVKIRLKTAESSSV